MKVEQEPLFTKGEKIGLVALAVLFFISLMVGVELHDWLVI